MRVTIGGAGIGGLTAALSLQAAGVRDVQVLEAAHEVREIGVGVNLPPHAVRELTELGLGDALAEIGLITSELSYYDPNGHLIWSEPRGRNAGYHWPQYSVHRGRLQGMLMTAVLQRLGKSAIHTGKRVMRVDCAQSQSVAVDVCDVTTGGMERWESNVYVAADGIRSTSRSSIVGPNVSLASNGWVMYRGATAHAPFLSGSSMVIVGDEKLRIVVYPLDHGTLNWLLVRPLKEGETFGELGHWNLPVDAASAATYVADWHFDWLDVPEMVRQTPNVYVYPMADLDPLPRWHLNCATLLGDAAHAMYPFGSNGASQAILDARVLAYYLAQSRSDPRVGLRRYEAERRETVAAVQLANRQQAGDVMAKVSALARSNAFDQAQEALHAVEQKYKRLAGFDVEGLNRRASWSVTSASAG
ncbi:salicylate hydroxylase [Ottowia sp. GY511]|uniref:FAD-dependent monooxygenase n=1 Tax=Ottowia flava TaxID=2675430 RepID=A0ABW4KUG0_9BURK|nr:FAD-dependent monooxygenase [Ottowia sp. GY511]TXK22512.1 salicylate hydroxylase [Ottowia sp. GY511]